MTKPVFTMDDEQRTMNKKRGDTVHGYVHCPQRVCLKRNKMPILKFKKFEDLEKIEREGKGISWNFRPDQTYFTKALRFSIKIPFPPGLYKLRRLKDGAHSGN